MSTNLPATVRGAHHMLSEIPHPSPAKANLKNIEIDRRPAVGAAMARARRAMGWSLDELSAAIKELTGKYPDVGQLSRWESGKERAHIDVLLFLPGFGAQFIVSLACTSPEVDRIEVETTIRVRRTG